MSKNEIAVREHFLPSAFQNKDEAKIRVFVEYEKHMLMFLHGSCE